MSPKTKPEAQSAEKHEEELAQAAVDTASQPMGVMTFEDELAAMAQQDAAKEVLSNPTIGTQGGVFSVDKQDAGTKLQLVVVADVYGNFFYEGDFDPDSPSSPVCYAYGKSGAEAEDMFPHDECEKPQGDKCATCPMNQWGTADKGKGKRCKNTRLLSVVAADDLHLKGEAKVYSLKVPVTSTNNFKVAVKKVAEAYKRPLFAVVLEVELERHKQHQFHMIFKPIGLVDDLEVIKYWRDRREPLAVDLMVPMPKNGERPEQEAPKRSGKY